MSYVVTAPLVLARDQEGKTHHKYHGAVIDWLPPDQAQHLLELGLVKKTNGQADEPAGDTASDDAAPAADAGAEAVERPKQVAPKADWVKFAVSKGLDPDEAESLNKIELIERYGKD